MKHDTWKPLVFVLYLAGVYFLLLRWFDTTPIEAAATSTDVETMTTEEKQAAMDAALEDTPMPELSPKQAAEAAATADALLDEPAVTKAPSGEFVAQAHQGAGSATLVNNDGDLQLVLSEDFRTDAGPQLHIFLSGTAEPTSSQDLHALGEADLGELQDASGAQVYDVPDNLDFTPASVVVYCVPFKVVFTTATLN